VTALPLSAAVAAWSEIIGEAAESATARMANLRIALALFAASRERVEAALHEAAEAGNEDGDGDGMYYAYAELKDVARCWNDGAALLDAARGVPLRLSQVQRCRKRARRELEAEAKAKSARRRKARAAEARATSSTKRGAGVDTAGLLGQGRCCSVAKCVLRRERGRFRLIMLVVALTLTAVALVVALEQQKLI